MSRAARTVEFAVVLIFVLAGIFFFAGATMYEAPSAAPVAPLPRVAVVANTPSSAPVIPAVATSTATTTATSSPIATKKKPAAPVSTQKASTVSVAAPEPAPAPTPIPTSQSDLDASASLLRNALVNIVCYAQAGSVFHSISGSGVIIDSKGIILTNAHVAQSFLLRDQGLSCVVRTGSPAKNAYRAALIYISPEWLSANSSAITEIAPTGTGEHDFALLAITGSATGDPLPDSFPSIPLATNPPAGLIPVVIASYAAQFLDTLQVENSLYPTIVFGSIKQFFTFAANTIDVLALGGSAAAQEGSSGGGVADAGGTLVGTITTSTVDGSTDTRSLDAISASYVRADYASDTGEPLDLLLAEPTDQSVNDFLAKKSQLESILTQAALQ